MYFAENENRWNIMISNLTHIIQIHRSSTYESMQIVRSIYYLLYNTIALERESTTLVATTSRTYFFGDVSIAPSPFRHPIIRHAGGNIVPVYKWSSIKRIKSLLVLDTVIGRRRLRDKSRQFRRLSQHSGIGPLNRRLVVTERESAHMPYYHVASFSANRRSLNCKLMQRRSLRRRKNWYARISYTSSPTSITIDRGRFADMSSRCLIIG